MTTRTRIGSSAGAALVVAATLVFATASALAAPAKHAASDSYPWPVKPFNQPHPIRGSFGDPRTLFFGPPTDRTLYAGNGSFTFHTGVDVSAPDGTAVYPVESGTVRSVSNTIGSRSRAAAAARSSTGTSRRPCRSASTSTPRAPCSATSSAAQVTSI